MIFAEVSFPPNRGSTTAGEVDAVFYYILAIAFFFSALIAFLLIFFAIRFRRRSEDFIPQPIVGSTRLEIAWLVGPLLIALSMFVWATSTYFKVGRPPDDAIDVYVVGRQWMWKIQHPGGAREINALHVPVGQPIRLVMTSEDVIHSFFVPEFRFKQDVLPGRYSYAWFEAAKPGTYDLFCAEYCGTGHSLMIGKVIAMEPEAFQRWLAEQPDGSLAKEGRKIFMDHQCVACHSADSQARGPLLEGIFRRMIPLADGSSVVADENYLRESILRPEAKVVAGFQPIMPTFEGQLSEEQILRLIAFLKSLGPGETPPRTANDTPPEAKPKETK